MSSLFVQVQYCTCLRTCFVPKKRPTQGATLKAKEPGA
jgi:hypothetical protein